MRPRYSFSSRRTRRTKKMSKQRQTYPELIKKIIENSDIILEVLDARFPEKTRNKEIEKEIIQLNKKIIYVLNKSDLTKSRKLKAYNYLSPNVAVSCVKRKGIKRFNKKNFKKNQKRR